MWQELNKMGYLFFPPVLRANYYQMISKTYFKTKDYCKVKFTLKPDNAESVAIAGLNGNWETLISMSKKKDGSFTAEISLPKESQHEFKYLINDSEWINEPEADTEQPNGFGSSNSVIIL
jgi:1,4-alpha-glucan branching enzyme